MYGELTPAIAQAVGESEAPRVLVPVNRCGTYLAGLVEQPPSRYLADAAALILKLARGEE